MDTLLFVGHMPNTPLSHFLAKSFDVESARDFGAAKRILARRRCAAVLAEFCLQDGRGYDLGAELGRSATHANTPLILLADNVSLKDRVNALRSGASDVLDEPVHPEEVLARLHVRIAEFEHRPRVMRVGNLLVVKPDLEKAYVRANNAQPCDLGLTRVEFKILMCFLEGLGRIWNRESLRCRVWGHNTAISARSIDVHVSKLRKKLGPARPYLRSVYGSGYAFSLTPPLSSQAKPSPAPARSSIKF